MNINRFIKLNGFAEKGKRHAFDDAVRKTSNCLGFAISLQKEVE